MRKSKVRIDVGDKFGLWTVTSEPYLMQGKKQRIGVVDLICICGKVSYARPSGLDSGSYKGCISCANKKHGKTNSKEYRIWNTMIQRCTNPKATSYDNYGARGVNVCDRWLKSFENFFNDMGEKPSNKTLDRKNNKLDYSPSNCKWSTLSEQSCNRRNAKNSITDLTHDNKTLTILEWSKITGLTTRVIKDRVRMGWSAEKALSTPLVRPKKLTYRGLSKTIPEWSKVTGIAYKTIGERLRNGWSIEKALTKPTL